jgi:hypothetical protein
MALDFGAGRAYLADSGDVHRCPPPLQHQPDEETMGSTPSGSAKPTTGAALPPHLEIDRDGGSRASVGGRI